MCEHRNHYRFFPCVFNARSFLGISLVTELSSHGRQPLFDLDQQHCHFTLEWWSWISLWRIHAGFKAIFDGCNNINP